MILIEPWGLTIIAIWEIEFLSKTSPVLKKLGCFKNVHHEKGIILKIHGETCQNDRDWAIRGPTPQILIESDWIIKCWENAFLTVQVEVCGLSSEDEDHHI